MVPLGGAGGGGAGAFVSVALGEKADDKGGWLEVVWKVLRDGGSVGPRERCIPSPPPGRFGGIASRRTSEKVETGDGDLWSV